MSGVSDWLFDAAESALAGPLDRGLVASVEEIKGDEDFVGVDVRLKVGVPASLGRSQGACWLMIHETIPLTVEDVDVDAVQEIAVGRIKLAIDDRVEMLEAEIGTLRRMRATLKTGGQDG